jgi:hypothetical protein
VIPRSHHKAFFSHFLSYRRKITGRFDTDEQSLATGEQNYLEQRRPVVAEAFEKMMAANGLSQPPRTPVILDSYL